MAGNISIYISKLKALYVVIIAAVLIIGGISACFILRQSGPKDTEIAAFVNNEAISVMELKDTMTRLKASVFMEFSKKYDAIDNYDFWHSSIDGENPLAVLRENALKEIVQRKIKLFLDKKYGLISDTDYPAILKDLDKENADRKSKIEKNETIYGPKKIDLNFYYTILDSKNDEELIKQLEKENIIKNSDENLKQFYEEIKDKYYKHPDRVTVLRIELQFANGNTDLNEEEAKNRIEQAEKRLKNGESFETVAKVFNKDGSLGQYTFDPDKFPKRDRKLLKIFEVAQGLKTGETSEAFQTDSTFEIIKCVGREDTGYSKFSDIKGNVEKQFEKAKFDQYISELTDNAVIKKNAAIFDKVSF